MQIYEIGLSSLLVKDYFHKFLWREAYHELTTCKQVVLESLVEAILRMRALNSYINFMERSARSQRESFVEVVLRMGALNGFGFCIQKNYSKGKQ